MHTNKLIELWWATPVMKTSSTFYMNYILLVNY